MIAPTSTKEHPILFKPDMVRAILGGSKTQTRRIIKPQPKGFWDTPTRCLAGDVLQCIVHDPKAGNVGKVRDEYIRSPYGPVGDHLWVCEPWQVWAEFDHLKPIDLPDDALRHVNYPNDGNKWDSRVRSPLHMVRPASRITLEVAGVRCERVASISRGDAMAEGCPFSNMANGPDPRHWFRSLWNEINGERGFGWTSNPWVWVYEFRRVQP
jgi:hypothetical protein